MNSIPCILIPVLVGLISAILGYLLGKMYGSSTSVGSGVHINDTDSLQAELDECDHKFGQLLADYNILKETLANSKPFEFVETVTAASDTEIAFNSDTAFKALGKKVKQDDLKIVEGIGPKIEQLFQTAGIKTWKDLGETSVDKCKQILQEAGSRFAIHDPGTWPKQSLLAYEGKWQELKDWQNSLDGGKA